MKKRFVLIFLLFVINSVQSKDNKDSLLKVINSSAHDTTKINSLNQLSWETYTKGDYKTALNYSKEANEFAKKIDFKKGIAASLGVSAVVYSQMGNPQIALKYYESALKIWEEIKNKKGINQVITNMGLIYTTSADFDKALSCNLKIIKLQKAGKDTSSIGKSYSNLGYTYYKMGDYEKSMYYTRASLKTDSFYQRKEGIAHAYNQLGLIYTALKEHDKAFKEFDKALKLFTEAGFLKNVPDVYNNIGNIYADQKNFKMALLNYEKNLEFYKEREDRYNYILSLYNIGTVYLETSDLKKALDAFMECEKISKELGAYDVLKESYVELSKVYKLQGNCAKSYENYILAINYRDTIYNEETSNNIIKTELKHEYDLAQISDSIKLSKEREIVAVKFEKEKSTRNALYVGLILVLITAFFIFRNLVQSKKANKVITLQKIEVEAQKKIVDEKNVLIEEKQKEIIDSINYAKRIQNSLIASTSILNQNLPNHFVLFTPKDIVSGDFYWATNTTEGFILGVGDCTGHGVPGAFMSLLNISKLNEAVNQKDIYNPDRILNYVRTEIISVLNPEGRNSDSNDGMDIVLLKLKGNQLEYAAANNSFYIIRNNELLTLKADKMPIGKSPNENIPFTLNIVELKKGDSIYLFTDGYADQFGGPKGKKYRYKQFEELLLANHHLPINEQRKLLDKTITDWKGDLEQIDDILVFGIQI